jgi:hypothetical protein
MSCKTKILIFMIFFCIIFSSFGQVNIEGKIISSETGERLDQDLKNNLIEINPGLKEVIHGSGDYADIAWILAGRTPFTTEKSEYVLALYSWGGNAAALLAFRKNGENYTLAGGYAYIFGGNGADLSIEKMDRTGDLLTISLKCIGHVRGYYIDPDKDDEDNYIPPSEDETSVQLLLTLK